jgi:hypothetical protein
MKIAVGSLLAVQALVSADAYDHKWCDSNDVERAFCVSWSIASSLINLQVEAKTTGYIAIGFADAPASMIPGTS